MEQEFRDKPSFEDRNDYAVALMYLGHNQEAVALLEKLEAEQPGKYFVAANLGTACELSGKNAEAIDVLDEDGAVTVFRGPWIEAGPVRGTGCMLSSAIAAGLANGQSLSESVAAAKQFVAAEIQNSQLTIQN